FICVGTPLKPDNDLDTSAVFSLAREIPQYVEDYKTVVIKSTVPVGTCAEFKRMVEERLIDTAEIDIVSNPEFMREGSALKDMYEADRIVIGT
ncbi:UDP-glucose 6-dehydrogenase, partial [Streptomyces brasiliscabiei]